MISNASVIHELTYGSIEDQQGYTQQTSSYPTVFNHHLIHSIFSSKNSMIGVVSDPLFMNHDTGGYHPEAPMRVHYIHTLFSGKDPDLAIIDPVPAKVEDIMLNHKRSHVDQVKRSCIANKYVDLDPDTVCSDDSYEVALCAAGSVIKLVELALKGGIDAGFASIRLRGLMQLLMNPWGSACSTMWPLQQGRLSRYSGSKGL